MTIWRQLGLQLGQVWKHPGAKLGPTRADSAASMQHAENVRFTSVSNVLALLV